MRIQVELSREKVTDLKWLMAMGALKTYYELFNNSLSVLKWATDETIEGRSIVSICDDTGKMRHLVTPFLQEAAKHSKPKAKPTTPKTSPKAKTSTGIA